MIAAPSVFRSGVEEAVSITIFNTAAETKVQVKLVVKGETVAVGHGSVLGKSSFFFFNLFDIVVISMKIH